MKRQTPYQFFKKHAGGSYRPGVETREQGMRRTARDLAKAEQWAEAEGLEYLIGDDDERSYCYCDDPTCEYHEGSERDRTDGWETICITLVRPCPEHGTECRHAIALGSLCGIMEPSPEYIRVVKAELALEAM